MCGTARRVSYKSADLLSNLCFTLLGFPKTFHSGPPGLKVQNGRIPKPFWSFLSRSRLLCTLETIENIALDLGNRVQSPFHFPEWASRRIAIAVFDNCLVKFDTSYEGVRADGDGSRQYPFINWLSSYIHQDDVPTIIDPGGIR